MGNCNQAPESSEPKLEFVIEAVEPEPGLEQGAFEEVYQSAPTLPLEGTLSRYRPGIRQPCIERWCEVNEQAFLYYKNIGAAKLGTEKPLELVVIDQIVEVKE